MLVYQLSKYKTTHRQCGGDLYLPQTLDLDRLSKVHVIKMAAWKYSAHICWDCLTILMPRFFDHHDTYVLFHFCFTSLTKETTSETDGCGSLKPVVSLQATNWNLGQSVACVNCSQYNEANFSPSGINVSCPQFCGDCGPCFCVNMKPLSMTSYIHQNTSLNLKMSMLSSSSTNNWPWKLHCVTTFEPC